MTSSSKHPIWVEGERDERRGENEEEGGERGGEKMKKRGG